MAVYVCIQEKQNGDTSVDKIDSIHVDHQRSHLSSHSGANQILNSLIHAATQSNLCNWKYIACNILHSIAYTVQILQM